MVAASELLIGLTMGFLLALLFTGIEVGVQLVAQQMGFMMAQVMDPLTQINTNILSQFYLLMVTLIYVLMNGHLVLIRSLAETFRTVPLMGVQVNCDILSMLTAVLTSSFMLGIRIAGPALIAVFLATLAMGFISRTMPQLNILAAGFPIRIMLSMALLIASLGSLMCLFQDSLVTVLLKVGTIFM